MKKLVLGIIAVIMLAFSVGTTHAQTVSITPEGEAWLANTHQWSWNPTYYRSTFILYAPSWAVYKSSKWSIKMDDGQMHLWAVNTASETPVPDANSAGPIGQTFKAADVTTPKGIVPLWVTELAYPLKASPPPRPK